MTDPTRRTVLKFSLASIAAGLAGCGGGASSDGIQGPNEVPTPPTTPPTTLPPTVTPPPEVVPPPVTPPPTLPASGPFFDGMGVSTRTLVNTAGDNAKGIAKVTKHTSWVSHPDGRDWVFGGDWTNASGDDTGAQTMYSLRPANWFDSDPATGWKLEHPWWPLDGNAYPAHRDKTAVAWDSKRRVFWDVGGYNAGKGADAPSGKSPIVAKVAYFDPAKPVGTQWTSTGVSYLAGGNESYGKAVYDPVLDVVISAVPDSTRPFQLWDCAGQTFFGCFGLWQLGTQWDGANGATLEVLSIEPATRSLYVRAKKDVRSGGAGGYFSPVTQVIYEIAKITLPSTRAELPAAGAAWVSWASRAKVIWTNSKGHLLMQGCVIEDGRRRLAYHWLRGPYVVWDQVAGQPAGTVQSGTVKGLDPGNAIYGTNGRNEVGNGSFGSANTGILIDLDTGAEQLTQLPHSQYSDGQGWIIPNITHWNAKTRTLWYGTCAFEGMEKAAGSWVGIEPFMRLVKKAVPSWVSSLGLHLWYAIPGSNCSTDLPAALRQLWSGSESAGGRGCWLQASASPWVYSGMSFRRTDSVCLFHGGGGAGGGQGNGILGFTLNSDSPGWSLPMPPTPASLCLPYVGGTQAWEFNRTLEQTQDSVFNGQKTPVAVHSYTSCQFIDGEDLWLRFGSQMVWANDQGYFNGVHGFYWSETTKPVGERLWSLNVRADMPKAGNLPNRSYVKHPWTEDVIGGSGGVFHWWKRTSNTWQQRIENWAISDERLTPSAIDPVNNVLLFAGNPSASIWPVLVELDTNTVRAGNSASWTGPAVESGDWKGSDAAFTWDDDNQCLWALKARNLESGADTSFDLYRITLAAKAGCVWRVEKVVTGVASGSVRPDFVDVDQGLYDRFKWVPELGGLVLSTSYRRPIWFIRTSYKA